MCLFWQESHFCHLMISEEDAQPKGGSQDANDQLKSSNQVLSVTQKMDRDNFQERLGDLLRSVAKVWSLNENAMQIMDYLISTGKENLVQINRKEKHPLTEHELDLIIAIAHMLDQNADTRVGQAIEALLKIICSEQKVVAEFDLNFVCADLDQTDPTGYLYPSCVLERGISKVGCKFLKTFKKSISESLGPIKIPDQVTTHKDTPPLFHIHELLGSSIMTLHISHHVSLVKVAVNMLETSTRVTVAVKHPIDGDLQFDHVKVALLSQHPDVKEALLALHPDSGSAMFLFLFFTERQ